VAVRAGAGGGNDQRRSTRMKRVSVGLGVIFLLIASASLGLAKDKKVSLTGTWDCQSHGGTMGDISFTLFLQQNKQDKELVDGSVSSPIGGTDISSGTFRKNMLEIHIDSPQGAYILMGKLEKGKFSGTWSTDNDKGTWDGSKHVEGAK
jgi:hypothetical protein